ncbi:hypothetical protein ACIQU4_19150 [Streptomyces sp. NPDC090741]|uniref:hypothetical protein n=1 Tax=Streptomyces sp. NPDC090741 TaxID=3365967 RepID=UPI00381E68ED
MRTPPRSATGRFERSELDRCAVDVARALAVDVLDAVEGAGHGHPGTAIKALKTAGSLTPAHPLRFQEPAEGLAHARQVGERARLDRAEWDERERDRRAGPPERAAELDRISARELAARVPGSDSVTDRVLPPAATADG